MDQSLLSIASRRVLTADGRYRLFGRVVDEILKQARVSRLPAAIEAWGAFANPN